MELIKEFECKSKDCFKTIIRIFQDKTGIVLEQTKQYDFDGSSKVDSIFIPNKHEVDLFGVLVDRITKEESF